MSKIDYTQYTKEELFEEVYKLSKRKTYGLVWEDKTEEVELHCRKELPVLVEVKSKGIKTDPSKPTNILIEGDNYHALSVLNYTHQAKIDVIYIDPPYNTGSNDFVYNDKIVDLEDGFRHSKWLSFMDNRLCLAKNLLKNNGIIFISIDDNEQANLRLLCDKIFGESNFVFQFVIDKTAQGANQSATFKQTHEYCLLYTKSTQVLINSDINIDTDDKKYKYHDERGLYAITNSFDSINSPLSANKNRGYTVYYNEKTGDAQIKDEYDRKNGNFNDFDQSLLKKGFTSIRPGIRKGIQYPWNWVSTRFLSDYKKDLVFMKNKKSELGIYHKNRATGKTKDTTLKRFDTRNFGNQLLVDILGEKKFDYPKSLDMMKWIVSKHNNKSAIILDFFAGSGTTGHAVLELNKEDGGNRHFILSTNNENNIATDVCYPRIKNVIQGYKNSKGEKNVGLGGNLKYYKIDTVKSDTTDACKKDLVDKAIAMICLKENCYDEIVNKKRYAIYKNMSAYTAILLDILRIDDLKKELHNIDKPIAIYIFSLTDENYSEDFEDIKHATVTPIPTSILKTYRRIFGPTI